MLATAVDKSGHGFAADNINASTGQAKAFSGKIAHRRREVEFSVEPGFHGVLVRGFHVNEMPRLQRAQVGIYHRGSKRGLLGMTRLQGKRLPPQKRDEKGSGSKGWPEPGLGPGNGSWGHRRQLGAHPAMQTCGCAFVELRPLKRLLQALFPREDFRALRARFEMALEIDGTGSVHLAIEVAVEESMGELTIHAEPPSQVGRGRCVIAGARGRERT